VCDQLALRLSQLLARLQLPAPQVATPRLYAPQLSQLLPPQPWSRPVSAQGARLPGQFQLLAPQLQAPRPQALVYLEEVAQGLYPQTSPLSTGSGERGGARIGGWSEGAPSTTHMVSEVGVWVQGL